MIRAGPDPPGGGGHGPGADLHGVVGAGCTDGRTDGQEAPTGTARTVLRPPHHRAAGPPGRAPLGAVSGSAS
ncbi:hypothetical protein FM21_32895 [Streptomyces mutabilis]|uniref:Uncharacterized protein n=1 Tax=Streptomyces mutabilis TaxID=67332 RepID=A0A086MRS4_9ACTN|nr:hypothetical protein FM21_32895 [Streptomyces mutabilis]